MLAKNPDFLLPPVARNAIRVICIQILISFQVAIEEFDRALHGEAEII